MCCWEGAGAHLLVCGCSCDVQRHLHRRNDANDTATPHPSPVPFTAKPMRKSVDKDRNPQRHNRKKKTQKTKQSAYHLCTRHKYYHPTDWNTAVARPLSHHTGPPRPIINPRSITLHVRKGKEAFRTCEYKEAFRKWKNDFRKEQTKKRLEDENRRSKNMNYIERRFENNRGLPKRQLWRSVSSIRTGIPKYKYKEAVRKRKEAFRKYWCREAFRK